MTSTHAMPAASLHVGDAQPSALSTIKMACEAGITFSLTPDGLFAECAHSTPPEALAMLIHYHATEIIHILTCPCGARPN